MSEDYEGDLLTQANALNAAIKVYLNENQNNINNEILESYKTDVLGYLVDIGDEEFGERSDRLTKDGIENDLRLHLNMINSLLSRGVGKPRKGKKSRRGKKSRHSKRRNKSKKVKKAKSKGRKY